MTLSGFVIRNAFRNKRRALLSTLSVAASLFLLVTLQTFLRELTVPPEDVGASLRIAVRNKVSLGMPLPARQRPLIEKIPGIAAVTPFTYFGGRFRDEEFTRFAQFAVDPQVFTNVFVDAYCPPEQLAEWFKDRNSCIVGQDTLKRYGIKVGDKMRLTGTFYPVDLDLKIAGAYSGTPDDRSVFFHHKNLDEMLGGGQTVGTWWVRAASAEVAPQVISTLNATFANTAAEVRAETESAFQLGFVSMWGNVRLLIGSISSVVVFTLLLVAVSTMSMAIRERFRELAILKALGYRRRELFGFILAESFGLAMVGALLGAGGAYALFSSIDIQKLSGGMFVFFEVTPRLVAMAFTVAAALGIVAAIPPAIAVARTSVVDGLKTLD
ncbi:MAG: FtsX-like permease family protein [Verrucomicrobiales bacterium]|nr:FtsX-like permease family protein [Verrucomicrobiales bacterium]